MKPHIWSRFRGGKNGKRWAVNDANSQELAEWADLPSFEYYMGAMPFPYDIESARQYYQAAEAQARELGIPFDHHYYVAGFLEAVYQVWQESRADS